MWHDTYIDEYLNRHLKTILGIFKQCVIVGIQVNPRAKQVFDWNLTILVENIAPT